MKLFFFLQTENVGRRMKRERIEDWKGMRRERDEEWKGMKSEREFFCAGNTHIVSVYSGTSGKRIQNSKTMNIGLSLHRECGNRPLPNVKLHFIM